MNRSGQVAAKCSRRGGFYMSCRSKLCNGGGNSSHRPMTCTVSLRNGQYLCRIPIGAYNTDTDVAGERYTRGAINLEAP